MMPLDVQTKITALIDAISTGNFARALKVADCSRLSEAELRHAVTNYGRKLVNPVSPNWDVVDMLAGGWSVRAPLWSEEEGQSDLAVVLSASVVAGKATVSFDDVLVP